MNLSRRVQPYLPLPVFAVLVDGDNLSPDVLQHTLLAVEQAKGEARVRVVFGNGETLRGMKEAANASGFRPVLHYALAERKNGVDVALAVAAMDLLHAGEVGSFCIASSDGDFLPLALRLREAGRYVLGMGTEATPEPLRAACHRFVVVGAKPPQGEAKPSAGAKPSTTPAAKPVRVPVQPTKPPLKSVAKLRTLMEKAFHGAVGEEGRVSLSSLGMQIRIHEPDFKPTTYGRKQLGLLVEEVGIFDVEAGAGNLKYVRLRR